MAAATEAKILELDARCYDEAKHRALLEESIREQQTTWFCCEFAPGDPDMLLAGSSEGGLRVYSVKGLAKSSAKQALQQQQQKSPAAQHLLCIQAHQGPCYSMAFIDNLLVTCGDDGAVRGWDWAEVRAAALARSDSSSGKVEIKARFEASLPAGGSGSLPPELNSVTAGDTPNKRVFAGAGDGSAYCWDLETGAEVVSVRGGGGGVLCTDLRGQSLALGCTGGSVQVWDMRSLDRPSACFTPGEASHSRKGAPPPPSACWPVRCLRFDSGGNWLFAGAGPRVLPWSMAAGALGKGLIDTDSALPHALVVEPNRVLVAGDEPLLRRYDFGGRLVSRAATDTVCTFGLSRCAETKVVALAGCSGRLDILADNGSKIGGLL